MIKRLTNYINRWRKPQGVIAYVDDTWVVSNIRILDCGIATEGDHLIIEPFRPGGDHVCMTITDGDDSAKIAVWGCEFEASEDE